MTRYYNVTESEYYLKKLGNKIRNKQNEKNGRPVDEPPETTELRWHIFGG